MFGRGKRDSDKAASVALLVVGLGNPGSQYENTRHNAGADAIAILAGRYSESLKPQNKVHALVAECRINSDRIACAFPTTYMNESGQSVQALMRRYHLSNPEQLIVVHDELDLPVGTVRIKRGGGLAGHNGLRSIVAHLKTQEFIRVRIGVGKPPGGKQGGANHVLSKGSAKEREEMQVSLQRAADAIESILSVGVDASMTTFNA